MNPSFNFLVDKENKNITVTREFAANRALVWDAYTQKDILDQWWAPHPWKTHTKTLDFREGGHWHYAMRGPNGEEHWAMANYGIIVAQERFTGLDAFADAEGNINKDMPQSEWDVRFSDKGENTLVSFNINYPDLAQLEATIEMGFKEGLASAMENLDALLPGLKQ